MENEGNILTELQHQITELKNEVNSLKNNAVNLQSVSPSTPINNHHERKEKASVWKVDMSVIIALIALIFSFGTTFYSARQAEKQRIHDARIELRGLVQRLSELPKENLEMTQAYTDALIIGQLSGLYQQENALLARQASEIISTIPEYVSSSEYIIVATAMYNSNLPDESIRLLSSAESVIRDNNDGVAVYRLKGNLLFLVGAIDNGREYFQKALKIFDDYPSPYPLHEINTHAQTYLLWAQSEVGQGFCQQAKDLFNQASEYAERLNLEGYPTLVEQQIQQTQQYIEACTP